MDNKTIHFLADFQLSKPTTKGERTFSGVAYAGGVITDHPCYNAIAFDLATTTAETPLPLLFNHCGSPIGVIETVSISTSIEIAGRLFADIDDVAKDIAAKSDRGIKWQLSVGIFPASTENLSGTQTHVINEQSFTGEITLLKQNRIREVSFVTMGADYKTSATIFNAANKDLKMALTPDEITALQDENKALAVKLLDMQTQIDGLNAATEKAIKCAREVDVKNLFTALGRDCAELDSSHYLGLTAEQFAEVSKDLLASKPQLPAHLFSAQTTGESAQLQSHAIDTMSIYAERNARIK